MVAKIVWLAEAVGDLEDIARHIDAQSSSFSGIVIARILETVDRLADFPLMGPVIREDETERHRHLICYNYRIIYRPHGRLRVCRGGDPRRARAAARRAGPRAAQ